MGNLSEQLKPEDQVTKVILDASSNGKESEHGIEDQVKDSKSSMGKMKEEAVSVVSLKFKEVWKFVKDLGLSGFAIIGKSILMSVLISVAFVLCMICWGPLSVLKVLLLVLATLVLFVSGVVFFVAWNTSRFIDKMAAPVLNTCSNFLSQKLNASEILNMEKVFDSSKNYVIEKAPILSPLLASVSYASFEKTLMKSSKVKNYSKIANNLVGGKINDVNNLFDSVNSIVSRISVVWQKPLGIMMKKSVFFSLLAVVVTLVMQIVVF